MARPKHTVSWKEASLLLHGINPSLYTVAALARLFGKDHCTMWAVIHPRERREYFQKRYQELRADPVKYAEHLEYKVRMHKRRMNDPNCREKYNAKKRDQMARSRAAER